MFVVDSHSGRVVRNCVVGSMLQVSVLSSATRKHRNKHAHSEDL
jgi:hypothetical protein